MSTIRCKLFGHRITVPTEGVELCERCDEHAAYYLDGSQWADWEYVGIVGTAWFWVRDRLPTLPRISTKCEYCHTPIGIHFGERYCNDECKDNGELPF